MVHQARTYIRALTTLPPLYLPALALLLFIALTSIYTHIPVAQFVRDPAAISGQNPFFGILSNIGILLWSAAATITFFTAKFLQNRVAAKGNVRFLFYSGLLTSFLLFDDLFLFHEEIFPTYFYIHEKLTFAIYGLLFGYYLYRFKEFILNTNLLLMALSILLFGNSMLFDTAIVTHALPAALYPWSYLIEDGFKILGILSWFGYFARTCLQTIHEYTTGENTISCQPHME